MGTLGGDAGFTLQTTYTGIAANQDRSATSLNNTNWFIADKGGLYTNNATTPSLSTNILVTKSFGGTVYVASTAATAAAVSTVSSPTASSLTGLPGLTIGADTKIQDFYLVQSGSSGANYDLLYTLDSTSKLNKFSLVGGSWTANGTYTLPSAGLALIAANNGSGGTYLYDTTATKLLEFHDTAGYNATINITTANNVTLYTATGTNVLKGLDFVPQANVATTTAITSVSPTTQAVGSPVTFTGTVTAGSGAAPTTGTVYFYNGGTSGTLLATATTANETTSGAVGTFTVSTSSLAPGTYSNIQAFYVAGTGFISGNSAVYGSSLTISGPTAPTITSGTNTAFTAGQSNTFSVTASGTPTITFTETGALPNGVTLTSAGVLSGNPAAVAQTTAYPITITAHNSGSPDATQAFTLYELPAASTPVAFTPGNILVYRVGDGGTTYGSAGTGGSAGGVAAKIFLDEYKPAGVFVQSVAVPAAASGGSLATVDSISSSSDGMLSLAADGHSVVFTGYNAAVGTTGITSSSSSTVARVIGTVNAAGVVTTNTTTTDYSGNNIRSAATVDGLEFWTSGNSASTVAGVRYDGQPNAAGTTTGVTNTSNTRSVAVINGQLYFSTTTGPGTSGYNVGPGVYATATPLPTSTPSSTTDSNLIGASPSPDQFTIVDMDGSGTLSSGDRLYYVDDTSTSGTEGLYRADYNGSSWGTPVLVASGITSLEGLTGKVSGGAAQLFATNTNTSFGTTTSFSTTLYTLTDNNATPTAGLSWTSLDSFSNAGSTAAPIEQFRGVSIVPKAVGPTPDNVTLTPSAGSSVFGATSVTFTATVSPSAAMGYVSFVSGGQTLATVAVSGGQAVWNSSPTDLPVGNDTVTAYYDGDGTYKANSGSTSVSVTGGTAPAITSPNTAGVVTGQSGTFQVTATGNPTTFTYGLTGSPPSWVTINSSTGVLSFNAPTGITTLTPYTFNVTASNGANPVATQSFTLSVTANTFIPGDLAVLQLAATGNNTTGSVVELAPFSNQSSPIQTVGIGSTGTNAIRLSDSGTSGFLSDTSDQSLLSFAGYNTTNSTVTDLATLTTANARAVGTFDYNENFNLPTTYTESVSGNQSRSATSVNDTNWAITDKAGLFTNNATASSLSPTVNILGSRSFGGTIYISSAKAAAGVSTVSGPTATGLTSLPGLPADSTIQDFYLLQSGNNGPTFDVLYTLDQGATVATINKFSLVSGSWVSSGSYALTTNATSMIAQNNGTGGANLYVVTTAQAADNSVVELADTAGYNAAINVTGTPVTLYTATGTSTLKGIALAPLAPTTMTETLSTNSVTPGNAVTFTAHITSPSGLNSGVVYFIDATTGTVLNTNAGSAITNGTASFTTSSLALGVHNVYAYYAGTTTIANAQTAAQQVAVTGTNTSATTISSAPNSSTLGLNVTITATVSGSAGNPMGPVDFYDGSTLLGQGTLGTTGGLTTATFSTTSLAIGMHPLSAVYNGDTTYRPSSSTNTDSQVVNAAATVTTINDGSTNAYGTVAAGSSVNFTATVVGNGLNGSPTGSVQFYEDGIAVGSPATLSGSGNTYTATGSIVIGQSGVQTGGINGSHLITAAYLGNSSYATVTNALPWIETAKQNFGIGDLLVLDRPNQASSAAQIVSIKEYTPSSTSSTLVQTIYLPDQNGTSPSGALNATTNTFGLSGHAGTEGALGLSGNQSLVSLFGFNLPIGTAGATSTSSATNARTALSIDNAGNIDSSTTIKVPTNDAFLNPRGAVSIDGKQFYVVGDATATTSGIALATEGTLNNPPTSIGTSASPNGLGTEGYGAEILGGQLYISTGATGACPD